LGESLKSFNIQRFLMPFMKTVNKPDISPCSPDCHPLSALAICPPLAHFASSDFNS